MHAWNILLLIITSLEVRTLYVYLHTSVVASLLFAIFGDLKLGRFMKDAVLKAPKRK